MVSTPNQNPIYEKQNGETQKQFEAFKVYRDMGLGRNLREVAKKLNKSLALIGRWSSANNWVERVHEYDSDMDRQEILDNVKKRKEMVKRHAQASKLFQQKIIERIQQLRPEELSTSDLIKWFDVAVKIERQSLGDLPELLANSKTEEEQLRLELLKLNIEKAQAEVKGNGKDHRVIIVNDKEAMRKAMENDGQSS